MKIKNRPITPHLILYKPENTSILSIELRISGLLLFFCLFFIPLFIPLYYNIYLYILFSMKLPIYINISCVYFLLNYLCIHSLIGFFIFYKTF
uniref:succinate:cytochrome c oxidoreductase subunit 3 n=1 Tax=Pulvinaster venetus TaxID=427767 RepID=UPI001FCE069C|nr:succinate:cytochrome c oxidoreductase subunit 3 [Pulvinaster venetus]UNJ18971.1 succinate:cytochrome c oxidoreductase subunit 3 [Pulvinaster venetus]